MKLFSCNNCAVVLDADNLVFESTTYDDTGEINKHVAEWDGTEWVSTIECPCCPNKITQADVDSASVEVICREIPPPPRDE